MLNFFIPVTNFDDTILWSGKDYDWITQQDIFIFFVHFNGR
jgi:hypothetical protein